MFVSQHPMHYVNIAFVNFFQYYAVFNTVLTKKNQSLPETGFQLFQKFAEQIRKWGWIISSGSNSSESFKK